MQFVDVEGLHILVWQLILILNTTERTLKALVYGFKIWLCCQGWCNMFICVYRGLLEIAFQHLVVCISSPSIGC